MAVMEESTSFVAGRRAARGAAIAGLALSLVLWVVSGLLPPEVATAGFISVWQFVTTGVSSATGVLVAAWILLSILGRTPGPAPEGPLDPETPFSGDGPGQWPGPGVYRRTADQSSCGRADGTGPGVYLRSETDPWPPEAPGEDEGDHGRAA